MPVQTHYGGTITPGGRLGHSVAEKTQFRTAVLLERLVRFDLQKTQGTSILSDDDIARVLNRSKRNIQRIRDTVPYLKKRMELLTGISTDAEEFVEASTKRHRQYLELAVPDAMRVIIDAVRTPIGPNTSLAEKKFRVETARDLLDRQGSFPRISRTDSHVKHEHDFLSVDGVSKELLDSLETPVQENSATEEMLQALATNKKFTNSETLTSAEMEASMTALEAMPVTTEVQ